MVDIKKVAEKIYLIDDLLYSLPKWGSVYLIDEEKKALIDTGPSTSARVVLDGIKEIGVKAEEIDYLIVTHIHLDHAGGAGTLLREMPKAQVLVHPRGARHLVNPERLVSSVLATMGEESARRDGEVIPIAEERIKPANDGDVLRLSDGQSLRFIDAPGHAPHQMCVHESRNNGLFTGDAVGLYVAENEVVLPATPPPSFDLELYLGTLEKLMEMRLDMLYFAHFGVSNKPQERLQSSRDRLQFYRDAIIRAASRNNFNGLMEEMVAQARAELAPIEMEPRYQYLTEVMIPMDVDGFIKWYQEKHGVA